MNFEGRALANPLLERIRQDFRAVTEKYPFTSALEIGCGPGFDVAWLASRFPGRAVTGVDISASMTELAQKRVSSLKLENAAIRQADDRNLPELFAPGTFDLVFVYFGALNTVRDLAESAGQIHGLLKPGGHAVLTFVNKWYLREMIVQLAKLNFRLAFARLRRTWGGYSPDRFLPSRCYSPKEIRKAFPALQLVERKGYSIFYPAWYNYRKWLDKMPATDRRWAMDGKLQKTCLWSKGEYTLFVFKKA